MIIAGEFAKLKKPFPKIPVPMQSGQVEERKDWSRASTAQEGQGHVLQDVEKQIQHSYEDEELELALLTLCSPKGCAVAH